MAFVGSKGGTPEDGEARRENAYFELDGYLTSQKSLHNVLLGDKEARVRCTPNVPGEHPPRLPSSQSRHDNLESYLQWVAQRQERMPYV